MKILQVVDVKHWAIGQLANVIEKGNPHLNIKTIAIHPKDLRNYPDVWIEVFKNEVIAFKPDVIHFHYWDTCNTLAPHAPGIKKMLTHHNQKNLLTHDWRNLDMIVVHTKKAEKILKEAGYPKVRVIQHGIDIEKFAFNENYDPANRTIGYCGRIVPWKNLYEIAKAAKELGLKVICMGKIDKADYWAKVQEYGDVLDIRFNTPDEKQTEVYHEMGVYVGNSSDGIEEGPLGLLEAMSCGVPVITTPSGEAADIIKDRENGIITEFEDYESLKNTIKMFFEMSEQDKNELRERAWDTVRTMHKDRMAGNYEKAYYKVGYEKDLVSVIMPTFNREETIVKMLEAYVKQTYQPIEVIVCDDGSTDNTKQVVFDWAKQNRGLTIKYINTGYEGYGLAMARNMGIFEASGHYLMFNDDRMEPLPDAIELLIKRLSGLKNLSAVWGDKGAGKRHFIENFFAIRKAHMVQAGMFNERLNEYGAQSQEVRTRLLRQGFILEYAQEAKAQALFGTRKNKRRYSILRMKNKLWKIER